MQLAWFALWADNARAMAIRFTKLGTSENCRQLESPRQPKTSSADVTLFRFGLRQLLLFVAAICTLLSALVSTSGLTALVLLVATAVVVMHVFATALGTRLRLRTDLEEPCQQHESKNSQSHARVISAPTRKSARSPWHGRGCTELPWLPRFVVVAMIVSGGAGAFFLSAAIGHRISTSGIAVGATSFAVLGGWVAFLCGNFYGVFRHGFREALAEQQKDQQSR